MRVNFFFLSRLGLGLRPQSAIGAGRRLRSGQGRLWDRVKVSMFSTTKVRVRRISNGPIELGDGCL